MKEREGEMCLEKHTYFIEYQYLMKIEVTE